MRAEATPGRWCQGPPAVAPRHQELASESLLHRRSRRVLRGCGPRARPADGRTADGGLGSPFRRQQARAQTLQLDVEFGEDAPRRGGVEAVSVGRRAREGLEGAYPMIHRGETRGSDRDGRRRALCIEEHLVTHC
jgi:hypothetical protein